MSPVLNVACPQRLVLNVAVLNVACPQCPIGINLLSKISPAEPPCVLGHHQLEQSKNNCDEGVFYDTNYHRYNDDDDN